MYIHESRNKYDPFSHFQKVKVWSKHVADVLLFLHFHPHQVVKSNIKC